MGIVGKSHPSWTDPHDGYYGPILPLSEEAQAGLTSQVWGSWGDRPVPMGPRSIAVLDAFHRLRAIGLIRIAEALFFKAYCLNWQYEWWTEYDTHVRVIMDSIREWANRGGAVHGWAMHTLSDLEKMYVAGWRCRQDYVINSGAVGGYYYPDSR